MKDDVMTWGLFGPEKPNPLTPAELKEKRKRRKPRTKENILPHTDAKLNLYSGYLEKYLAILSTIEFIERIHLFDIFCGAGVYEDGKVGSPIIAYDIIYKVQNHFKKLNKSIKPVTLHINDLKAENLKTIEQIIIGRNYKINCDFTVDNVDADLMFSFVINYINRLDYKHKCLIFIDPYGYSKIKKATIKSLLETNKVEIILFLPVSFMHRFKDVVQIKDRKDYESLRNFIFTFFPKDHVIRTQTETIPIFDFIRYIRDALTCQLQDFQSTSHYLQRNKSNYYALFFVTKSYLGLERIIDTKWELDPLKGEGFRQNESQGILFNDDNNIKQCKLKQLEDNLELNLIKESKLSNCDIYLLSLSLDFRPKHATEILKKWSASNKIAIERYDGDKPRKNAFYISNKSSNKEPEIFIYFT